MVIDTSSYDSIKKTLVKNFNLTETRLYDLILEAMNAARKKDLPFNTDIFHTKLREIIIEYYCKECPNEIMLFHLSRRLNGIQDVNGYNLDHLLTTENVLSDFFKKHDICFSKNEYGHIDIIYKNKLISLTDEFQDGVGYLRNRLGHNKNRIDNCFNGFMFGYGLELEYTKTLRKGPEFLQCLSRFLNNQNILNDYMKNSSYYCFSYKLPLNKVIFDFNDKLTLVEKSYYLIESILIRIYEDKFLEKMKVKQIRYCV